MLEITVHMSPELYDEKTQQFFYDSKSDVKLELEHSLISLSKWEAKHEKPFLGDDKKSDEDVIDYIRCMIVTPDYPPEVFSHFTQDIVDEINAYIEAKMSATWFADIKTPSRNRKTITSELIYYWIVSYQIPWDVEHWHLNRLFTLIKVFNEENKPEKEKKQKINADALARRRALNEERKKELKTSG